MNILTKYFPWLVVGAFVLYAAGKMYPKRELYKDFDLSAFGAIPVLDGGRIKPLDSVARTKMLFISGRSDFEDTQGNSQPAILWLLETLAWGDPNSGPAAEYRVFRVDNEQVLAELGLEERPGSYRYSWKEIVKSRDKFWPALLAARKIDEKQRDLFHSKILELGGRMERYEGLATGKSLTVVPSEPGSKVWRSLSEVDELAARPFGPAARSRATAEVDRILRDSGKNPDALTPAEEDRRDRIISQLASEYVRQYAVAERKSINPAAGAFGDILAAYKDNKPKGFSEAIATYRSQHVQPLNPEFRDKTRFERAFNAASPFIISAFAYIFAGVLAALSWLGWSGPLKKAAFGMTVVALALHAGGLLGRMYLMGRPLVFVTNLYSSALLIGCAGVACCLIMERLFKSGVGLVVGTTLGAVTVKIAHHLSTDGSDTLGMLVAVLDTNLWLASHVTTVTLGYSATYIAGLLGIAFIFQMLTTVVVQSFQTPNRMTIGEGIAFTMATAGIVFVPCLFVYFALSTLSTVAGVIPPELAQLLQYLALLVALAYGGTLIVLRLMAIAAPTPAHAGAFPGVVKILQPASLDSKSTSKLSQMIYGVICFATLLSFVGTVLGGIWADQSWGRFWGWDPKENGAVLIVIWNALILHARWGGIVRQRGMAVLAVVGIMVTTWSWFGTNQLGVGLHNYGFNKTLAEGCMWTWFGSSLVIALGLIPTRYWRSFSPTGEPRPETRLTTKQGPEASINGPIIPGPPRLEQPAHSNCPGEEAQDLATLKGTLTGLRLWAFGRLPPAEFCSTLVHIFAPPPESDIWAVGEYPTPFSTGWFAQCPVPSRLRNSSNSFVRAE